MASWSLAQNSAVGGAEARRNDAAPAAPASAVYPWPPLIASISRRASVDEADATVAEPDQVGDGGARARDVVAGDGGQLGRDRRMVHEDDPDAAPGQNLEVVERGGRGRHDDAAHVQAGQQAHELALAIGIGVGRAQHGDPVVLAQAILDTTGRLGEEWVGDVVDEHPDQ